MAESRRDKPLCTKPKIRLPWERVAVYPETGEGRTHQSFKDECDINNIIDLHARTGIVNHVQRGELQYGDAPEVSMFEAACAQAAIRSAEHDGWEPPEEATEAEAEPEAAESESEPQEAPEAPQEAHEG